MNQIPVSTNNAESNSNGTNGFRKIDLQLNVLATIRRRLSLLIFSGVVGALCGTAYFLYAPVTYESEAQILLMQNDSGAMVSSVSKGENGISEDLLATHMSLMQSSRIVQNALNTPVALGHEEPQIAIVEPGTLTSVAVAPQDQSNSNVVQKPVVPAIDQAIPNADSSTVSADSSTAQPESLPSLSANEVQALELETTGGAEVEEAASLANLPSILEKLKPNQTAADFVIDKLYVTRGGTGQARNARILTLSFRHSSPDDAKLIVEAIVAEYTKYVQSKFKDINQEAVDLIQKARKDLQTSIEANYETYREFRNNSPLLAIKGTGGNIHAVRYEELSAELSRLNLLINEQTGRLEMVKERLTELQEAKALDLEKLALIDIQNAERLGILVTVERGESQTASFQAMQPERMAGAQAEYSTLLQLKAKRGDAMKEYGNQHPAVVSLENQIGEMEEFISKRETLLGTKKGNDNVLTPDDVMKAYIRLLDSDLAALTRRRSDLEKEILDTEAAAKSLIDYELQEEELARNLKREEDLYSSVVERLRDINMQQESSNLILEVIQEPVYGKKVSPSLPIAGVVAIMSSLLLAGFTVLIAEISDKRVHSAEELEQVLESRVLAHVVDFNRDPESRKAVKLAKRSNSTIAPDVLTFHDPKHQVSEVYRNVRTELMFISASEHAVFGVTSPSQGDGKSTSSANLAVSLARTGKSVMLLDADMRRPSVHRLFNLPTSKGLADYLDNKASLADVIAPSGVDNLSVIRASHSSESAAELLSSARFAELIDTLKKDYDYVLVDCPPLLPVSDPAIIAPLMDGIVLVATTTNLSVQDLKQCKRILDSKQAKLVGVMVNRAVHSNSGYEYKGYIDSNYTSTSGS